MHYRQDMRLLFVILAFLPLVSSATISISTGGGSFSVASGGSSVSVTSSGGGVSVTTDGDSISVSISGGKCNSAKGCPSGDKCQNGICQFSGSGTVDLDVTGLKDGNLCLSDKNCINQCINNRCTKKNGNGGPCGSNKDCKPGFKCKKRECIKNGGSSGNNASSSSSSSNSRSPTNVKKENGETCKYNGECKNVCVFKKCRNAVSFGGVCQKKADCKKGIVCRNGKCQKKNGQAKPNGSRCKSEVQCQNACIFSKCVAARGMGGRCMRGIHCKGRLICRNGRCRDLARIKR